MSLSVASQFAGMLLSCNQLACANRRLWYIQLSWALGKGCTCIFRITILMWKFNYYFVMFVDRAWRKLCQVSFVFCNLVVNCSTNDSFIPNNQRHGLCVTITINLSLIGAFSGLWRQQKINTIYYLLNIPTFRVLYRLHGHGWLLLHWVVKGYLF